MEKKLTFAETLRLKVAQQNIHVNIRTASVQAGETVS